MFHICAYLLIGNERIDFVVVLRNIEFLCKEIDKIWGMRSSCGGNGLCAKDLIAHDFLCSIVIVRYPNALLCFLLAVTCRGVSGGCFKVKLCGFVFSNLIVNIQKPRSVTCEKPLGFNWSNLIVNTQKPRILTYGSSGLGVYFKVDTYGFTICKSFLGHGIGKNFHTMPDVLPYVYQMLVQWPTLLSSSSTSNP